MFKHKNVRWTNNAKQSSDCTENYEDDDSYYETYVNGWLNFTRTVSDEVTMRNINVPEHKKRNNDAITANKECEGVTANSIDYKVKLRKLFTKKELNFYTNDKIITCKHLLGVNMKIILDHLIREIIE